MTRAFIFSLAMLHFVSANAQEKPTQTVNSSISSVTVYTGRALVKRTFSSKLQAGFVSLQITDLPSTMINESVRVTGRGTSGATISGVRVEEKYLEESAQESIKRLQDQKEQLESQIRALEDRKAVLTSKKSFVESISQSTSKSIAENIAVQRPSIEEWTGMVSFVDKTLSAIGSESRSIDAELKDLNTKKSIIDKELMGRQHSSGESQKTVVVDLDMDDPGTLSMELSYIVNGADWTPIYDIRASSENDTISVIFMANVRQNTGEDWNNVQLELSTAKPFAGAAPRDLIPWYLNVVDADRLRMKAGGRYSGTLALEGLDTINKMVQVPAEEVSQMTQMAETQMAVANVSQQLISTSFVLKQPETIPSDNKSKKVSVKVAATEGKKEYFAIPKSSNYVYLRSKIVNKTSFPLLPGRASVFFDGGFVSTTNIPLVVPTESFDMFLGIDENIRLKRELVGRFSDETGIMTRKNKVEYTYRITLENLRKDGNRITVLDQIPITQDDRIDVKLQDINPDPQFKSDDEEKGILRWVMDLQPGEKKELSFKYEIKYPAGLLIDGLN